MPMWKDEVRQLLPEVGEVRWEVPAYMSGQRICPARRCVVVEVNHAHLWYAVRFENGYRESYKLPTLEQENGGGFYG